ncbi:hypothetical protein DLM75_20315 [Leptospira stimsonii]|uniref:Uncharacterized protein n=1 Tax=Leptospira stimsonii TaxID=2202203 RepID=A0A396YVW8_9LEPT|nr:hypothetical protein DLM75_20315 [Leptospira stimsonii]
MGLAINPGQKNTKGEFKKFITDHMSKANPDYSDPQVADEIYAVRNSLVHSYGDSDATAKLNLDFVIDQITSENLLTFVTNIGRIGRCNWC